MRLAAQAKMGYYPCSPEAVSAIAGRIRYTQGQILDPCAGEGLAIERLAEGMGVPPYDIFAVELDDNRGAALTERLSKSHVLAPADYCNTMITANSFSVTWCNPPFDTNIGGGRVEADFLWRSMRLTCRHGVLVFICPKTLLRNSWEQVPKIIMANMDNVAILSFPDEHAPYGECAVIGNVRKTMNPAFSDEHGSWLKMPRHGLFECPLTWDAAPGYFPSRFEKTAMTESELVEALRHSPLWKDVVQTDAGMMRPPLPLGKGHRALLLASGHLNGVVYPPNEEPHVVRGTARKVQLPPDETEEELPSGQIKTTTIIKESIKLFVRTVDKSGTITTLE